MKKPIELPFRVDRNLRTNLVDQVVDRRHVAFVIIMRGWFVV